MPKLPINSIIDIAKTHGPKVIQTIKENKEAISVVVPFVGVGAAKVRDFQAHRKEVSTTKEHYRKTRYTEYKNDILVKLDDHKKLQLVNYKDEVESFIAQIENEEKQEFKLKKPLHSKRIEGWKKILIQLEDKMKIKDYQEYLKLFNNPTSTSSYFEGYDRKLTFYKELINEDKIKQIHEFIFEQTEKTKQIIERDFSN